MLADDGLAAMLLGLLPGILALLAFQIAQQCLMSEQKTIVVPLVVIMNSNSAFPRDSSNQC